MHGLMFFEKHFTCLKTTQFSPFSMDPSTPNSSTKSVEETSGPSIPPEAPQPLEGPQMANPDQDREYGCKYCRKKFSNKQALGGHQNAHKVERAIEKNAREAHDNHFGFFGGGGGGGASSYSGITSSPFLGSYNRSHEFLNRSIINRPFPSQQPPQQGIHAGYNPRPPMAGEPYAPRPLPGFNNVYSGWAGPLPRIPQFTGQPSHMQNQSPNRRFLAFGAGSSNARPFSEGLSTFAGSRFRPDRNRGGQNIIQINDPFNQQSDDSELDLSLKL